MPIYSTAEEEDEFLSLSWLPQPGEDLLDHRLPPIPIEESLDAGHLAEPARGGAAPAAGAEQSAAEPVASAPPRSSAPISQMLLAARRSSMASRRISPWWPVVQIIGGKWRVKPLPILMLIIAIEGFFLGMTEAQRNYYASPELRAPVRIERVFTIGSHAARAIAQGAEHAISVTLNAGQKLEHSIHLGRHRASGAGAIVVPPTLYGLSAHYLNPHTLAVSFDETGCSQLQLIVASGPAVLYDKPVTSEHVIVPVREGLQDPLRITIVGTAPGGIELRQHSFLALPFANRDTSDQP
jgi:hypothetical protein